LNLKELDSIVDALGNFLAGAVVVLGLFALQLPFPRVNSQRCADYPLVLELQLSFPNVSLHLSPSPIHTHTHSPCVAFSLFTATRWLGGRLALCGT
jgi:hypothetical protein